MGGGGLFGHGDAGLEKTIREVLGLASHDGFGLEALCLLALSYSPSAALVGLFRVGRQKGR